MLEINQLSKTYNNGQVRAVDSISFSLKEGQIASIVGTSGCGKTTTLKMINGLVLPSSGEIKIHGKQFHQSNPIQWRREIGYVIQKAGLLPHLTVFQNISILSKVMGRENSHINQRVEELMDMVNMNYSKFKDRYPIELSGGQQQRVGVARALMENPPLMLMDEPFGALDPITRNSLHEEFLNINQKLKKTIIIVTHDLEEAFKLSDVIILMNAGKIEQMGTRDDLVNSPANEFVQNFMSGHLEEGES